MIASRIVNKNGKNYRVEADPTTAGKYLSLITPPGQYVREPDTQATDPNTGVTTTTPGRMVEFDTEKAALDGGEENVKLGII